MSHQGNPDISIVIPVYQVATHRLERAVQSVSKQVSGLTYEIILVLDGEQLNDDDIVTLLADCPEARLLRMGHCGVGGARNTGIDASLGDWILFLDADDFLPEGTLAAYEAVCLERRADMVFANHSRMYGNEHKRIDVYHDVSRYEGSADDVRGLVGIILSNGSDQGTVWGKIFRRDFLKDNALAFDTRLENGEDQEFMVRCVLAMRCVVTISASCYVYVYSSMSAVRAYRSDYAEQCAATLELVRLDLLQHGCMSDLRHVYQVYCLDRLLLTIINGIYNPGSPLSSAERNAMLKKISHMDVYHDALNDDAICEFPFLKRLVLELTRYRCYPMVSLIAGVRQKMLNGRGKRR